MKHAALLLVALFTLGVSSSTALPLIQHSRIGVVHAIDLANGVLTLESAGKDEPTEFIIIEGRTRLRRDKKPATLAEAGVGQTVHVYYKKESGRWIATEVSWTSSPIESKPEERRRP